MSKKFRSAIVCVGGNAPDKNVLLWQIELCIAADAGILTCKELGFDAHVLIGDFDTISIEKARQYFPHAKSIVHDRYKDDTDTTLGLKYVYESDNNINDVSIIGGEGGDVDHFLAILSQCSCDYAANRIITKTQQIEIIRDTFAVKLPKNSKISFFSVDNTPSRQKTKGLRWSLDDLELSCNKTSARNEVVDGFVEVHVERGRLIAIWDHHNTPQRL